MQETRNKCFGSKKCSTTLCQAKKGKHKCRTLLLYFGTRAYMFLPDEWSCSIFSTRNNCCEFLMLLLFKMLFIHSRHQNLKIHKYETMFIEIHANIFFCIIYIFKCDLLPMNKSIFTIALINKACFLKFFPYINLILRLCK